jgi:AsmA family protein
LAIRIPWRQIAWITVISLPLAAVGAVVWGSARDLSRYQSRLMEQIHKATGRELAVHVPLSIHLGRDPALVAEGVTLSNAPWGSRPDLARVRKLTMYLDPVSLFLGEVKVGRILVEGADILVEPNEVGDTNLEMLPPPDGSGPRPSDNRSLRIQTKPAFPWIETIEVRDSVLTVAQGSGRPPVVLDVANATFKSSGPGQSLQVEARLQAPQAAAFDLSGIIGTFDGWIRGLPGNIDVQGGLGDGHLTIKGTIGALKGTNLQIAGQGADIAAFGPYLHLPLPSGGPYEFTARTITERNGFKVEVPSLKVGNSDLAGEALFRTERSGTPTVTVNIDSNKIDLGGLHAPAPPSAAAGQTPTARRFFPTAAFSANWLGRSTLSLTARAGEITGLSGKVQNGSVTLTSSEKRFTFRGAASIGSGSAGFDLVYDPAGRFGLTTLTGTASHVSFQDLATLFGLDLGLKDAVGDIDLRLRGGGRAAHDALNVANGTIEISAAKGTWPRDTLTDWPVETKRLLGGNDDGVPFNCLAGSFEVKGGIANLRRLVVDTPRAVLIGGGYLSFKNEGWEFILAPEARDSQGVALASPLRIKGGTGRQATGTLEPGLAKLLIGAGPVPSLSGTLAQIARQPNVNACAIMETRLDGMRPGLRAQLPTPVVEHERPNRRPAPQQKLRHGRSR